MICLVVIDLVSKKQARKYVACLPCITQKEVLKSYELEFMGGQKLTEIIQYMVYRQKKSSSEFTTDEAF